MGSPEGGNGACTEPAGGAAGRWEPAAAALFLLPFLFRRVLVRAVEGFTRAKGSRATWREAPAHRPFLRAHQPTLAHLLAAPPPAGRGLFRAAVGGHRLQHRAHQARHGGPGRAQVRPGEVRAAGQAAPRAQQPGGRLQALQGARCAALRTVCVSVCVRFEGRWGQGRAPQARHDCGVALAEELLSRGLQQGGAWWWRRRARPAERAVLRCAVLRCLFRTARRAR